MCVGMRCSRATPTSTGFGTPQTALPLACKWPPRLDHDLRAESVFLRRFDRVYKAVNDAVDMNNNDLVLLVRASLQNNGNFDASSVEVWAVAPDDSITLSDNLIGGGGRVRAGGHVVRHALRQQRRRGEIGEALREVDRAVLGGQPRHDGEDGGADMRQAGRESIHGICLVFVRTL